MKTKKVIIITDGDVYAHRSIEHLAKQFGGCTISQSQGNPTKFSGKKMVEIIMQAQKEPIFVLFDDSGFMGEGPGEKALKYVANDKHIEVIAALAVASNTHHQEWTRVDVSIDNEGNLTEYGVDKFGVPDIELGRINGDTVYNLDQLNIPLIIGIGDIGKMGGRDDIEKGSPITRKAIEYILERSEFLDNKNGIN
ncbi:MULTISPECIES: stage V sporulation protein AE [Gottfriedia]|uniref:Stage V sporulation protein AE n=1 Tax=Gottfriedia solisilvae TaxID=1516104 RepID=A0A8J3ADC3_9BACI|nr:stage V sporulation protein AE [Gottfriedia solisilvae]GGI12118.1 stage V sporulation protein AE [Gottfriedia solisilvae]